MSVCLIITMSVCLIITMSVCLIIDMSVCLIITCVCNNYCFVAPGNVCLRFLPVSCDYHMTITCVSYSVVIDTDIPETFQLQVFDLLIQRLLEVTIVADEYLVSLLEQFGPLYKYHGMSC